MLPELPITNYQLRKIKFYSLIGVIAVAVVIVLGNIIAALVHDSIRVDEKAYSVVDGFPLFHSEKDYIDFVRKYPRCLGIRLTVHKMRAGESYWDIMSRHDITLDTLIAANPFMKDLVPQEGEEIVIPSQNGVLFPFDDFYDVIRMKKRMKFKGAIGGHYLPTPFHIISTDDVRLVFFKQGRPQLLNDSMARLYDLRKMFQPPVKGSYTSMYGDRVNPLYHEAGFHNGIDFMAPQGRPIKPIMEGIVFFTGWRGGYGNTIMIQHADGYSSLYGHLSAIHVKNGDWVDRDKVIGLVGSTGRSTGSHLHFTFMRHGDIINPLNFIW